MHTLRRNHSSGSPHPGLDLSLHRTAARRLGDGIFGPFPSRPILSWRLAYVLFLMEVYSLEMNHLPVEERAKQNYDAPNAIDVQLLEKHIHDYAAGHAIQAPIYDFAQHLRVHDRHEHIAAKSLLIVEGILALPFAQLRPHFDPSIYLDAPEDICFHRRKVRDITERQRSLDFILWQYKNAVLPATRPPLPSGMHPLAVGALRDRAGQSAE
jgi:uridine kinase